MLNIFKKKNKKENNNLHTTKSLKGKKNNLFSKIVNIFSTKNDTKEIEKLLLSADIDYSTVKDIVENVNFNKDQWQQQLKNYFESILLTKTLDLNSEKLNIIEIIGVNGVGKTTFISKLSNFYKKRGYKILLSAADTFRAAAIDQLNYWADKLNIDIISQSPGADPAAVVFDSIDKAISKKYNLLIIDTAGRLQNKEQLMNQLKKIDKVITKKIDENRLSNIEINVIHLLILDANIGKNSLNQLEIFNNFVKIDAFAMTKLDSTAKGGLIFSIFNKYKIPIFAISFGEQINNYLDSSDDNFKERLINLI